LGRPSFREKAPIANFLPDINVIAYGNPELEMTSMQSYDARLEWFPSPGDVISVGVFYKDLKRPIELYSLTLTDDVVTWVNRTNGTSTVMGIEFEARKSLEFLSPQFKGLTLGVNATFIDSETKLSAEELSAKQINDPHASDTRPLYDQSPYIINLDLSYDHPTSGTSFSIGANLTGERIVLAKLQGPDIYEHPPITLDAAVSQKFWKRWTARFGVRNILDPQFRQTYGSSYNDNIYQSYKRGRTFGVTLTAEF
jgi:outer membrane receptor protein involved in Fe transport